MVSELATSLSADARIDPAMDPFDRAIRLCEKMLVMLCGGAVQPEDSGVDQEIADDSDNATGISDGAVPTKCSTLDFSTNVGGAEVGFSPMQPEDSDADQELATGCDDATNISDGAVPAKCSTLGLTPNVGGVEVVDSSQLTGVVSMVIAGTVGAPPPSTMEQFGILKLDKHMPTICSTVILDMGSDAMRAERDTKRVQAGLVYSPSAAAALPATMPPDPPDQPRLLLDRPLPWPLWMSSCTLSTAHRCAWLLPMLSVSLVPSSTTVAPSSTTTPAAALPPVRPWMMLRLRMESKQDYHHLLWLLLLSACGQAEILGEVKGSCTARIALHHTRRPPAYSWVLDGTVVIFTNCGDHPFALPGYNISSGRSTCIVKDGLVSALLQIIDKLLKLPWLPEVNGLMVAEIFTKRFVCPSILQSHVLSVSTGAYEGNFSWRQQHTAWIIVDSINDPDLSFRCENKGELIGKQIMCSYCTLQVHNAGNVKLLPSGLEKVADSHKLELHLEVIPKLFARQSTSSAAGTTEQIPFDAPAKFSPCQIIFNPEHSHHFLMNSWIRDPSSTLYVCLNTWAVAQWTNFQRVHSVGVQGAMFLHLIMLQQKLGDWCDPRMTLAMCSSFSSIGMTTTCLVSLHFASWRCAEFFSPNSMLPVIIQAAHPTAEIMFSDLNAAGDRICSLVMLSINLPWDPGVPNELIREGVLSELAQQENVQQIDAQAALFLHMNIPLQQKHSGWIFLRRTWSPAKQLLHGRSDMVGCMFSSPITTPWDPDAQIGKTSPDGILFQPALVFLASRQLTVLWLWDPGGLPLTLGLRASRNLRRGECHGLDYEMGRGGLGGLGPAYRPKLATRAATNGKRRDRDGGTERIDDLLSPLPPFRLPPNPLYLWILP